jgi:putative intracellular protease/amidase
VPLRRPTTRARWGAGRITAAVAAGLAVLVGLGALAAGATAVVYDQTQRDANDYLMSGSRNYATQTYALVSDSYHAGTSGPRGIERAVAGRFRVRTASDRRVFVGIGRAEAVDSYLAGVRHAIATRIYAGPSDFRVVPGAAPTAAPAANGIWAAQALGDGTETLSWLPRSGRWRIVVMNADGAAGVHADVAIGARFPHLLRTGIGALVGGVLLIALGVVAIRGASMTRRDQKN